MQIKHIKNLTNELSDMASELASQAIDGYGKDLMQRQYLYFRPSESGSNGMPGGFFHRVGDVCVAVDMGGGYEIATNEFIPRNMDKGQLSTWIYNILTKLPIC